MSSDDVAQLIKHQVSIERYCRCGFCESLLPPKLLPVTMPAKLVECEECFTTGSIEYIEHVKI